MTRHAISASRRAIEPLSDEPGHVPLGSVCIEKTGTRDPRQTPDRNFFYVDISSVDNVTKRIINAKEVIGAEAPSRARQAIRTGDVLVSTTRPNLNAVAMVPENLDGEICSTGFCVLRAIPENLHAEYLFAFVQSPKFVQQLSNSVKGALYPAVTDRQVREQLIPLPSLPEQKRVTSWLNEQFALIDTAWAANDEAASASAALIPRLLDTTFSDHAAKGSTERALGDLLELRKEVVHPRDNPHGPTHFVGLEHIESGTGRRIGSVAVRMEDLTGRKPRFYAGDIVYGYLRPYLNKVWIADCDGLCSVDQYVYRVNFEEVRPAYVAWFMRSPVFLRRAPISYTPGQLPRIRTDEVAAVRLAVPSLAEQDAALTRLEKEIAAAAMLRGALSQRSVSLTKMSDALLSAAFAGAA